MAEEDRKQSGCQLASSKDEVKQDRVENWQELNKIARILLICARPVIPKDHVDTLLRIAQTGIDWITLFRAANENLVLPMAAQHLLPLVEKWGSRHVVAQIKSARSQAIMRMMHVTSVKHQVVETIRKHCGEKYAELKGAAISRLLYGDEFTRQYRDVDILISESDIQEIAEELIARGFDIINKEWIKNKIKDVSALTSYQAAVELMSPTGVVVELHRRMDNSGCVFSPGKILLKTNHEGFNGGLPPHVHLAYMLFHHSRHKWSLLHWCADLNQMCTLPADLLEKTKKYACEVGLQHTLQEALLLAEDLEDYAKNGTNRSTDRSKFTYGCLSGVIEATRGAFAQPGLERSDEEIRQPDFAYDWQKTAKYRIKFALSRMAPNLNDYNAWPLPQNTRWLYWLTKPFRVTAGRVIGR
jgi:hypothetical protein